MLPLDASTIVVPSRIQPLTRPKRNSERASRCLRLPVRWVDSSFRYSCTPQCSGSGTEYRWVSAERLFSALILRMASSAQARSCWCAVFTASSLPGAAGRQR